MRFSSVRSRVARVILASLCALFLAIANRASARPPHKQSLTRYYGARLAVSLNACTTCHLSREEVDDPDSFDAEAPPHNPFGVRLRVLGEELEKLDQPSIIPARLQRIADEDADGDGVANELEILSGHQPGRHADVPTAEELETARLTLAEFRAENAAYRWAPFEQVSRPAVPDVADDGWARSPIDAFIAAEHRRHGLTPRPEAPPHVLLRRVYFDLIGLPPTRDELREFLADTSPDAWQRVVETLLASPHYGERWGRHWMDVWRYSDWAGWGEQVRDSLPHIWHWRDWIIESLNADLPYDQMVVDMLAADELAPADEKRLRATGFLARNYKLLSREQWLQDTLNHTAQAFLGITLECARCHDHRYDPIRQVEYYRARAIFEPHNVRTDRLPGEADIKKNGLPRAFDADSAAVTYLFVRGDERAPDKDTKIEPGVPAFLGGEYRAEPISLPAEVYYPGLQLYIQTESLEQARGRLAEAEAALAANTGGASIDFAVAEKARATARAELASLEARIAADRARYSNPPAADAAALKQTAANAERIAVLCRAEEEQLAAERQLVELAMKHPAETANEKQKQALAEAEAKVAEATKKRDAAAEAIFKSNGEYSPLTDTYPATTTGRRTALARWLVDRSNPLAARVAVNQIWLRHFGRAIVESVTDFGQNGTPPTHPDLLDWLAAELMEPSWFAAAEPRTQAAAPWSMKHLHRLIVMSSVYRTASTPDEACAETDPDNRFLWRMSSRRLEAELVRDSVLHVAGQLDLTMGGPELDHAQGLTARRRSLYFRHAAEKQMTFLKLFDAPAVTECYRRKESIVPQQALALANSPLAIEQSRLLARKLSEQVPEAAGFLDAAFEQVLSRSATKEERETCLGFLDERSRFFSDQQSRLVDVAQTPADVALPSCDARLRARENLVHVLLNHNDFVMIR